MAIVGIEKLIYGVDDLDTCSRFFEDFGLPVKTRSTKEAIFVLEEGSSIILKKLDDPSLPASRLRGNGVKEVWWAVDSTQHLEELVVHLQTVTEVVRDEDGVAHFVPPFGYPMALCLSTKRPVITAPDPVNSPGNVNRLNRNRKWHVRARPRVINHITIAVENINETFDFLQRNLGFRLTDRQGRLGLYCRADGARVHHSMAILDCSSGLFGTDGALGFHHANFGVEDIDEIMVGANYMERRGWPKSHLGLGRHRLDSALFLYLPCPAGGEVEYGTDQDVVDDSWVPRDWYVEEFGFVTFVTNLPAMLKVEPEWAFKYIEGTVPNGQPPS